MKRSWYFFILFLVLAGVYTVEPFRLDVDITAIFLTVSTFLFAVITGFFISRQNSRHETIRQHIAVFDGNVTAIYRGFAIFGDETQKRAEKIIRTHYDNILKNRQWDYPLTHKTTTITSLNALLSESAGDTDYHSYKHHTINNMITSLDTLQAARKQMVSLYIERIPFIEKLLVVVMAGVLLLTLFMIPAEHLFLGPLMKSFFGTIIVTVVVILFQLDSMTLFEGLPGEASAMDIINIIEGKR
jgi:hypothetical protein